MVFDKTKAMRNAERHVAQGKIQLAIGEYKQVVTHDPKDFGTLNMLGDLYAKTSEKKQAISCYTSVAEHYSKQGFAQKAIAVYNKISKLEPGSAEISEKLAELYRAKGSVNEARTHYNIVAEHYESQGRKLEALEVRKQIASLDPTDTAIYLDLAVAYLKEHQAEEAAAAFAEAGARLAKKSKHTEAIAAFEKAIELFPTDAKTLAAFVQSHFALATPRDAADRLRTIYEAEPLNRDVEHLLIDCYLEARDKVESEKTIIALVEKEPTDYPKLIDLARLYLSDGEAEAAGRVMSMLSEHLLLAGQADEFQALLTDILAIDPEQLEALRLRARLAVWQRDESVMQNALACLATVAKTRESVDDERFALSQLVMMAPKETQYADRLKEINEKFGFEDAYAPPESLFDAQFHKGSEAGSESHAPVLEAAAVPAAADVDDGYGDFAIVGAHSGNGSRHAGGDELDHDKLAREVDSIRFYIDSGYLDLADKAIRELREEFGECDEIGELVDYLKQQKAANGESDLIEEEVSPEPARVQAEAPAPEPAPIAATTPVPAASNGKATTNAPNVGLQDLRSELGLDDIDSETDSDYDTHYHTAVAYQEMGLLDEAIKEFQDAVGLVQPNDPNRRFFQCANLLGHCFMQKSMPHLALTWFQRALETPALSDEEKQGIWYELALAYEADGDMSNAGRYFEQVYAENIDFRDVSERVKNIVVGQ
jgi:tetratricopeptide (TPR) repeat protein